MSDFQVVRGPRLLDHFTLVPDWLTRHPQLSFRAVGVMVEVLSHTPGWRINSTELAARRPEGREAVRTAMRELQSVGLISRQQNRDGGRFSTYQRAACRPEMPLRPDDPDSPWVQDHFQMLRNDVARSSDLSYRELGVLVAALSWPAGEQLKVEDLRRDRPGGRDIVYKAIAGLERAGHVHRRQLKTSSNRFGSVLYYVLEEPVAVTDIDDYLQRMPATPTRRSTPKVPHLEGQTDLLDMLGATSSRTSDEGREEDKGQVTPLTENPSPENPSPTITATEKTAADSRALTEDDLQKRTTGGGRSPHQRAHTVIDPLDVPRDEFGPRTWRCALHANDDRDVPCRGCAVVREEFEEASVARRAARAAARNAAVAAARTQPQTAEVENPEPPVVDQQLAAAHSAPPSAPEPQAEDLGPEDAELIADRERCLAEGMTIAQWTRDWQRRQANRVRERESAERAAREQARQDARAARRASSAATDSQETAAPKQVDDETAAPPQTSEVREPTTGTAAPRDVEDISPERGQDQDRPLAEAPPAWPKDLARPAIVLDVDCIGLPTGQEVPVPFWPTHVGQLEDLAERYAIGTQVTATWWHQPQVWLTDAAWARLLGVQLPDQQPTNQRELRELLEPLATGTPFTLDAIAAGYELLGPGDRGDALLGWMTIRRPGTPGIRVVSLPSLSRSATDMPVLAGDPTPGQIARRLALIQTEIGRPWVVSPSTTGLDLLAESRPYETRDVDLAAYEPSPPASGRAEDDITWSRALDTLADGEVFLHGLDRAGAHMTGVIGNDFGIGEARHVDQQWDGNPAKTYGYGLIEIPAPADWRLPNPLDPTGAQVGQTAWRHLATIAYGRELGYDLPIHEAWVWDTKKRLMDPWYKTLAGASVTLDNAAHPGTSDRDRALTPRRAQAVADPDALAARAQIKVIYTRTIGMIASHTHLAGRRGYAPDRRDAIVAKSRNNLLRRAMKIGNHPDLGVWPVAVSTDTLVYASHTPDPREAFAHSAWDGHLGVKMGTLHYVGSATVAAMAEHLTGRQFGGLSMLDDQWNPEEHR